MKNAFNSPRNPALTAGEDAAAAAPLPTATIVVGEPYKLVENAEDEGKEEEDGDVGDAREALGSDSCLTRGSLLLSRLPECKPAHDFGLWKASKLLTKRSTLSNART